MKQMSFAKACTMDTIGLLLELYAMRQDTRIPVSTRNRIYGITQQAFRNYSDETILQAYLQSVEEVTKNV